MSTLDGILKSKITSTFALIAGEVELHHFDRYPVLYSGLNIFGSRILGSLVEEVNDSRLRFFHTLLTGDKYLEFLTRKISYRDILTNAESVFVIETKTPLKGGDIWEIAAKAIPADYLPDVDSFCPQGEAINAMEYGMHLVGANANRHLVRIPDLENIIRETSQLLKCPFKLLKGYVSPEVYVKAFAPASFEVDFLVEVSGDQLDWLSSNEEIIPYVNDYLDLSLNYLSLEKIESLVPVDFKNDKRIDGMVANLDKWSAKAGLQTLKLETNQILDSVRDAMEHLGSIASIAGPGFVSAEFEQKWGTEKKHIAIVKTANETDLNKRVKRINGLLGDNIRDRKSGSYRVQVYALNRETLSARAYVIEKDDKMTKARLEFTNPNQNQVDKLAESLRYKKLLHATGVATRRRGDICELDVEDI